MLKPEHWKWFRKRFFRGTNSDIDPNELAEGDYTDSYNMRNASTDGESGALKRIGGERLHFDAPGTVADPDSYVCIGDVSINGNDVGYWASSLANQPNPGDHPPLIIVDGVLSAMSPLIPYRFDRPLQIAPQEQCANGEGILYPADHWSDPMWWDVASLILNNPNNLNTQYYFNAFNALLQQVGLNAPPLIFWLDRNEPLKDVGGAQGQPTGQYRYFGRWVTIDGNRTNWGPPTMLIAVPEKYHANGSVSGNQQEDAAHSIYPGGRTYGGFPSSPLIGTSYGIHLRYRADNPFGYGSIEIGRQRFNDGAGLTGAGVMEVVARIPIQQGFNPIQDFIDPEDANITPEIIPDAEAATQLISIHAPKTVEYANRRLTYANFMTDAQPTGMTWLQVAGKKMTAITKKLVSLVNGVQVPDGYSNPYHSTHLVSAARGEAYSYAAQLWNGAQGLFYAINMDEPQQVGTDQFVFPERKDIKGAGSGTNQQFGYGSDSLIYSDDRIDGTTTDVTGTLSAEGQVGATFDVFTQGEKAKIDCTSLVNVSEPGVDVGRDTAQFGEYAPNILPPNSPWSFTVPSPGVGPDPVNGYQPWHPTGNNDGTVRSWSIPPNTSRMFGPAGAGGAAPTPASYYDQNFQANPQDAKGKVFAPTTHALGGLIYGLDNIPPGATCLSIVRTERAGRVIAQGFGSYALTEAQPGGGRIAAAPATKSTNALWVSFPEITAGAISAAKLTDIQTNPSKYKIRITAGYGFYNEIYGYSGEQFSGAPGSTTPWCNDSVGAWLMDMVTYARITHDEGQVNVGEPPAGGMGYQPALGSLASFFNWVGFDKWRRQGPMDGIFNPASSTYSFWQQQQTGNALFDIQSLTPIGNGGRGNLFRLVTNQYIYAPDCNDVVDLLGPNTAFNDTVLRNFHQPFFVVNIIEEGAEVPESNSTPLINMGMHIGINTRIGIFSSAVDTYELLGEREWMDCANYLPTDFRYAYVLTPTSGQQRWICFTGNSFVFANLAVIINDINTNNFWIAPDGLPVYGLYEMLVAADGTRSLRFGAFGIFPEVGSSIHVKYDKTAPIHTYGHDTTVNPQIHAVLDRYANRKDVNDGTNYGFLLGGLPLPYAGVGMNPRYWMPEAGLQTEEQIRVNYLASLRQWCIVWDAETRLNAGYYVNATSIPGTSREDLQQFFEKVHYVQRLYLWDDPITSGAQAGFFDQYDTDYPGETGIWRFGGLRYLPAVNFDYAKQVSPQFFALPRAGFVDNTDKCTWFAASNVFNPFQQDSPSLRTFTSAGLHPLSEETGEIKVIISMDRGESQDMHFWTQRGHGFVLTNKRFLTSVTGDIVGTQAIDGYWGDEVFKSRTKGMPDELWRVYGKGSAPAGGTLVDTVFWADRDGVYRMSSGAFAPIADDKWLKKLLPELAIIGSGYDDNVTGIYDPTKGEYLIAIQHQSADPAARHTPFVYSAKRSQWGGGYGHTFDRFVVHGTMLYGMRDLQTFELDGTATQQNGSTIIGWGEAAFAPQPGIRHEVVAFRVHPSKPDRIEIYDNQHNLIFYTDQATQDALTPGTGALWILRIDGWQAECGRSNPDIDPARKRLQDELFFIRVIYNTVNFPQSTKDVLSDVQLQLKPLV